MCKLFTILVLIIQYSALTSADGLLLSTDEVSLTCGSITFIDTYTESIKCSLKEVKSSGIDVVVTSSDIDMDGLISRDNYVDIDITGDEKYPESFPRLLSMTLAGTTTFTYSKTPLKVVRRDDLKDFGAKLSILSLNDNKIEEIAYDSFYKLTNLRNLILSNNKLKTLPSKLLTNAPLLDTLFVNFNDLTQIHPDLFTDCSEFHFLNAENNKIEKIEKDLFKNNSYLRIVLMSHNKIKSTAVDFTKFKFLESADFTHNSGTCDTMYFSSEPYDANEKNKWIKTVPKFQEKIEDVCGDLN